MYIFNDSLPELIMLMQQYQLNHELSLSLNTAAAFYLNEASNIRWVLALLRLYLPLPSPVICSSCLTKQSTCHFSLSGYGLLHIPSHFLLLLATTSHKRLNGEIMTFTLSYKELNSRMYSLI